MNLETLKAELADPAYTGLSEDQAAELLNTPAVADLAYVDGRALLANINLVEFAKLEDWQRNFVSLVIQFSPPLTSQLKQNLAELVPEAVGTQAKPVSRAEVLGLVKVGPHHVAEARKLALSQSEVIGGK